MKSKKGKTYSEMVARMQAGAREERLHEEAATREQNKSETLQIRIESDLALKIAAIAQAKGIKQSTLVRTWLDKMVDQELYKTSNSQLTVAEENVFVRSEDITKEILDKLSDIQMRVKKLSD